MNRPALAFSGQFNVLSWWQPIRAIKMIWTMRDFLTISILFPYATSASRATFDGRRLTGFGSHACSVQACRESQPRAGKHPARPDPHPRQPSHITIHFTWIVPGDRIRYYWAESYLPFGAWQHYNYTSRVKRAKARLIKLSIPGSANCEATKSGFHRPWRKNNDNGCTWLRGAVL